MTTSDFTGTDYPGPAADAAAEAGLGRDRPAGCNPREAWSEKVGGKARSKPCSASRSSVAARPSSRSPRSAGASAAAAAAAPARPKARPGSRAWLRRVVAAA